MKFICGLFLCLGLIANCLAVAPVPRVKPSDFAVVSGARWVGSLTYLDYGSQSKVLIPSQITVKKSADKFSWIFVYEYPNEHKADSTETIVISRDGKLIGDEKVVERSFADKATLRIVTEKNGMDNDKPSLFRYTYLLSKTSFSIKKEVRYDGTTEFFTRNEYSWKR